MRHQFISASQAKNRFFELTRQVNECGKAFLITRYGEPIGALVPMEDYEALLETADVLSDPNTLKDLEEALEDEKKGRLWKRDRSGKWVKRKKRNRKAA